MNTGTRILLMDEQGNYRHVSGAEHDVRTRGGVFGAQGYGGGIFDGSLDGLGDTTCTSACAALLALPNGAALAAACNAACAVQGGAANVGAPEVTPLPAPSAGCTVPDVCQQVAKLAPTAIDPSLLANFCSLPPDVQTTIDQTCNAVWLQMMGSGTIPAPIPGQPSPYPAPPGQPAPAPAPLPGPAPAPGPAPTPTPSVPPAEAKAGISPWVIGGGVAAAAVLLYFAFGRK